MLDEQDVDTVKGSVVNQRSPQLLMHDPKASFVSNLIRKPSSPVESEKILSR